MYWIYDLPSWQSATLVVGVFVLINLFGLLAVRRALGPGPQSRTDAEIVNFFMSGATALYGITLGLIAVGTWDNFSSASKAVGQEASAVAALYRSVAYYPQPYSAQAIAAIKEYLRYAVEDSWPAQRKGVQLGLGAQKLTDIQLAIVAFKPQTNGETVMHAHALRQVSQLSEVRRQRVQSAQTGLPALLYYVVTFGGLVNISIGWFFRAGRPAHILTSTLFAGLLGSLIFLIIALDNPFRGELSVNPDALADILQALRKS